MRKLTLVEYKKTILNVLIKIDKICRENNLTYMVFYGTLLGAVRHKGFIPWDDDIDIIMPRNDYDKLREIINNNDFGLNFLSVFTNEDMIYACGKVCDSNTILYEKNFEHVDGYGAFVDVFPYDYAENNKYIRMLKQKILKAEGIIATHTSRTSYEKSSSLITNVKRKLAFDFSRFINTQKLLKLIQRQMIKKDNKITSFYRIRWGYVFRVEDLDSTCDVEFENHLFMAPRNIDGVLKQLFGDYMQLPPEEEQINKHQLECYIMDEYMEKNNEFRD